MPSFDVVSEVDVQEVRNAIDQAQRELATRFDFKGTDSSDEKAREIGKYIKGLGLKGVQHQVQADQLRVTGKKRDDLQAAIKSLREHDFGVPLEFTNFRD